MKYTVASSPFADYQLASIWLRAKNRQQVTDASNRIESLLKQDADRLGRLRPDGLRALVLFPLVYTFEVSPDDCRVTVLSIRYLEPPEQP